MKLEFNDKIKDIDRLLSSKRSKWILNNILSFEDLSQIIRVHIFKKFDKWDQVRPFDPWCSRVIDRQIRNEIRNKYSRLVPPCIKNRGCPFNTGDGCQFTNSGKKDSSCAAYAKWEATKKPAYELRVALPLEDYDGSTTQSDCNLDKSIPKFHEHIKQMLPPRLIEAYQLLYIDNLSDNEAAEKLGFRTNEKKRTPGYRQIINMKKDILAIAQKAINSFDLEF